MRKRLTLIVAMSGRDSHRGAGLAAIAGRRARGPDGNTQAIAVKLHAEEALENDADPGHARRDDDDDHARPTPNGKPVPAVEAIVDFDKGADDLQQGLPDLRCRPSCRTRSTEVGARKPARRRRSAAAQRHALLPRRDKGLHRADDGDRLQRRAPGRQAGGPAAHLRPGAGPDDAGPGRRRSASYNKEGYGPRLDVQIPLIAGGSGALTDFHVTIFKKYTYKGKKRSYVSATCPTKKLKARGKFVFRDGQSLTAGSDPEVHAEAERRNRRAAESDVEPRQHPLQRARQPPDPLADQQHQRRQQDDADHGGVEQHRDGQPDRRAG